MAKDSCRLESRFCAMSARLAKVLSPMKLRSPAAIYGGPALVAEWSSLSGASVLQVTGPNSDDVMSIVKLS